MQCQTARQLIHQVVARQLQSQHFPFAHAALSAIAKTFDHYERERFVPLIENEALLSFDIMIDDYHSNLTK